MYAIIFLIINTSFLIYLYNDYFPFSLKATYCTLILHDSMVFFGSLKFLFFFIFRESNACLSLDEYLFIARNVLCLWFEWDWYGAIVIVRLWNMFKYMIVYDSHSKSACEVKKQLCKFIYSIIYRYMYYVWQQFIVKHKDVKILKNFL